MMKVKNNVEVKRSQVWLADLGTGTGSEQGNIRPVLVVSNNKGNYFSSIITIVPLTSKNKKSLPTHVMIDEYFLNNTSIALIEQVRTISKERLIKFMGETNNKIMVDIDSAIRMQMNLYQKVEMVEIFEILKQIMATKEIIKQIGETKELKYLLNSQKITLNKYCKKHNLNKDKIIIEFKEKYSKKITKSNTFEE